MFKNYIKLAIKVLMRRKMFTFINLFGISFTLMILLAATTLYVSLGVYNPVEKNLSKSLYLQQVEVWFTENGCNIGPANSYTIEKAVKPIKNAEMVAVCTRGNQTHSIFIKNTRVDIDIKKTDANFFEIFTLSFIEGKPYSTNDLESGKKVCVISHSLKTILFGNEPGVGKNIDLNSEKYKVIGVVKDVPKLYKNAYAQLWRPYNYEAYMSCVSKKNFNNTEFLVIVKAKNRGDFESIRKQFATNIKNLKPKDYYELKASLITPAQLNFGDITGDNTYTLRDDRIKRKIFLIIFVVLFLSIPLLNLTNLTVSRIFERSSEIGVRKAFGATKRQMILQFIYENILVCLLGGVLGFIGAWFLLKGINSMGLAEIGTVNFNFTIFFYGLIVILLFGILSGFYPALKMSKLTIIETLKGNSK